jgi:hypothetical protein
MGDLFEFAGSLSQAAPQRSGGLLMALEALRGDERFEPPPGEAPRLMPRTVVFRRRPAAARSKLWLPQTFDQLAEPQQPVSFLALQLESHRR